MECGTVVPPFPAQHAAPHDKAVVNCRSPKRRRDAGCHTGETMTAITGDKTPVVVCAADRRYAMPLAVMLKSLETNLAPASRATVYVLDGGIGRRNKARLLAGLGPGRLDIRWLPPPHRDQVAGLPVFGHAQISVYYRILIPSLLPVGHRKVIYLDADLLVLGDISRLWNIPLDGKPLLAAPQGDTRLSSPDGLSGYQEWGLPADARYLNSGVLVFDLDQWRQENFAAAILDFLRKHREHVRFWDQDGINAVLAGRWGELEREWNVIVDCFLPDEKTAPPDQTPERLKQRAAIVHFASATKPWNYYVDHPARELFYEYLDRTAWAGWQPRTPLRALRNRHYWGALLRRMVGAK